MDLFVVGDQRDKAEVELDEERLMAVDMILTYCSDTKC
jgi:hypothetical protein